MANFFPIQTNFGGGVISPRLFSRVDAALYGKSLESCENWQVLPQGSLRRRGGYAYQFPALNRDIVRLIDLPSRGKWYTIELTPGKLRLFDQNGLVVMGSPQIIENNRFQRKGYAWTETLGGTSAKIVYIPASSQVAMLRTNTQSALLYQDLNNRSLLKPSTSYTLQFTFAGQDAGTHLQVAVQDVGAAVPLLSVDVLPGTYSYTFTTPAAFTGDIVLSFNAATNNKWVYITAPTVRLTTGGTGTTLDTPYMTAGQIASVQYSYSAATEETFFANLTDPPQHLIRPDPAVEEYTFGAMTFTSPPPEWAVGNYPGSVEVYQGRLWYAATPIEPNMVWASQTNVLNDFSLGAQDKATDALSFRVATKGGIQWLKSQRTMLCGTVMGEYNIYSTGSAVTPMDITIREQSSFGSSRIQPRTAGDQLLYVSLDGRKIRAASYELSTNGWTAADLTYFSPEITGALVTEISFARDPHEMILCVLSDGSVAGCTYHRPSETVAWWTSRTNGRVLSLSPSFYVSGSVWAAVYRENGTYIEKIAMDTSTLFLDSGVTRPIEDVPPGTVTGLSHLEGRTVGVMTGDAINGFAVEPDKVVTGGQITVENVDAADAQVGLKYTSKAITLPLEGGNPGGSGQGVMKGRDRIFTRIFSSALPLINGYRVADDRTPAQPMDTPEALRTGDALLANLGVDRYAKVTVEQDLAAATNISGIFGRSQVNSL